MATNDSPKKKKTIITIVILAILALIVIWFIAGYNGLVKEQETAKAQWSNVQTQYQRRANLIPSLVATVKGYAKHEEGTLTAVVEARAKATSVTIKSDEELTPEKIEQFKAAQEELSGALSRLLVSVEAYPDLKASDNFMAFQSQLEGTENRISVERQKYNECVKEYNIKIRVFPRNIIAGIFGFDPMATYEAPAGAETAPIVEF